LSYFHLHSVFINLSSVLFLIVAFFFRVAVADGLKFYIFRQWSVWFSCLDIWR